MGIGAGHIADMNARIRDNMRQLGGKGHYRKNKEKYINIARKEFRDTLQLSKEERNLIRERLKAEASRSSHKSWFILLLSIGILAISLLLLQWIWQYLG